ncbi:MAG: hypothetical protein RLZZ387_1117, partial [Chloroflexota bacterium]
MPDLSTALELIDAFVAQRMAAVGSPGLALALTGRDQTIALRCYGLADTGARAPVTPDTLFEIGSIGKTFTAVALAQEAEAGRLDPRRPLRDYLPWLGLPEPRGPVAPHHLLCHTAGITAGPDFTPEARFQLLALRDLPPSSPPGARFHYSNLGYKALGLLLERLAGAPYPQVIAERILRPLGMDASAPAITAEIRPRLAVGYAPLYDDRPWHPSRPLLPAPFLETATADGCVAATAGDMAAFARALLGRGAPLLGEAGFGLLTSRAHPFDDQHAYGYGINVQQIDGRTHLWHHGGMPGFVAHLRCDLDSGLAAVALVNGPGAPTTICTFALACLRAALSGEPLPELPPPADRTRVERAAEYAGTFVWRGGGSGAPPDLTLEAESERLYLVRGGERVSLEPRGEDAFFAPHPELDGFLLQFGRDAAGRVVEAAH